MRVPELDWPNDLFQDVLPVPDLPMTIAAQIQTAAQKPLWTVMRGVWMARHKGRSRDRRDMTSDARLAAARRSDGRGALHEGR